MLPSKRYRISLQYSRLTLIAALCCAAGTLLTVTTSMAIGRLLGDLGAVGMLVFGIKAVFVDQALKHQLDDLHISCNGPSGYFVLPQWKWHELDQRSRLLRAVKSPAPPDQLLRSATSAETSDADKLLRAAIN